MSFVSRSLSDKDNEDEDEERPNGSLSVDDILGRYSKWLDSNPLRSRCFAYAIVGAIGSLLGSRKPARKRISGSTIDWVEVVSFTLHGALVAGPLSHYTNDFIEETCETGSQMVLADQLIAQPPKLFIMFAFLEVTRAAIVSIPGGLSRSMMLVGKTVVDSWRFWPLSIYVLLRVLKKRKHYDGAMNLTSIAWIYHLSRYRSRKRAQK